ncbi:hypothetical protein BaRGS_00018116 [Batillaria attramentaria]|uniref:PiggyBac transposable element-derived protein domain-containing protein n=1 Tax=Batillaria attramentaria TaxID=370345 RepID=A0ABD0KU12_9CAEN
MVEVSGGVQRHQNNKIYLCCESDGEKKGSGGGYCYRFKVYTGKDDPVNEVRPILEATNAMNPSLSASENMVLFLVAPLLGKGYHVYTDNWYLSLKMFMFLLEKQTLACGTVREASSAKVTFCSCESEFVTLVRYRLWLSTPSTSTVAFTFSLMELCRVLQTEGQLSLYKFCASLQKRKYFMHSISLQKQESLYRSITGDPLTEFRLHQCTLQDLKVFPGFNPLIATEDIAYRPPRA